MAPLAQHIPVADLYLFLPKSAADQAFDEPTATIEHRSVIAELDGGEPVSVVRGGYGTAQGITETIVMDAPEDGAWGASKRL